MITLWILGLVLVLFAVGGISLDLWRVFGDRRELVSMADAAAAAGASAIDEQRFRDTGEVHLDEGLVTERVQQSLAENTHAGEITSVTIAVVGDQVQVDLSRNTELTLLGLIVPNQSIEVVAHASAAPFASP
ncbi:MAG: pilus assembly protein TadG-related protein [Acidimicrobiia bacterium]